MQDVTSAVELLHKHTADELRQLQQSVDILHTSARDTLVVDVHAAHARLSRAVEGATLKLQRVAMELRYKNTPDVFDVYDDTKACGWSDTWDCHTALHAVLHMFTSLPPPIIQCCDVGCDLMTVLDKNEIETHGAVFVACPYHQEELEDQIKYAIGAKYVDNTSRYFINVLGTRRSSHVPMTRERDYLTGTYLPGDAVTVEVGTKRTLMLFVEYRDDGKIVVAPWNERRERKQHDLPLNAEAREVFHTDLGRMTVLRSQVHLGAQVAPGFYTLHGAVINEDNVNVYATWRMRVLLHYATVVIEMESDRRKYVFNSLFAKKIEGEAHAVPVQIGRMKCSLAYKDGKFVSNTEFIFPNLDIVNVRFGRRVYGDTFAFKPPGEKMFTVTWSHAERAMSNWVQRDFDKAFGHLLGISRGLVTNGTVCDHRTGEKWPLAAEFSHGWSCEIAHCLRIDRHAYYMTEPVYQNAKGSVEVARHAKKPLGTNILGLAWQTYAKAELKFRQEQNAVDYLKALKTAPFELRTLLDRFMLSSGEGKDLVKVSLAKDLAWFTDVFDYLDKASTKNTPMYRQPEGDKPTVFHTIHGCSVDHLYTFSDFLLGEETLVFVGDSAEDLKAGDNVETEKQVREKIEAHEKTFQPEARESEDGITNEVAEVMEGIVAEQKTRSKNEFNVNDNKAFNERIDKRDELDDLKKKRRVLIKKLETDVQDSNFVKKIAWMGWCRVHQYELTKLQDTDRTPIVPLQRGTILPDVQDLIARLEGVETERYTIRRHGSRNIDFHAKPSGSITFFNMIAEMHRTRLLKLVPFLKEFEEIRAAFTENHIDSPVYHPMTECLKTQLDEQLRNHEMSMEVLRMEAEYREQIMRVQDWYQCWFVKHVLLSLDINKDEDLVRFAKQAFAVHMRYLNSHAYWCEEHPRFNADAQRLALESRLALIEMSWCEPKRSLRNPGDSYLYPTYGGVMQKKKDLTADDQVDVKLLEAFIDDAAGREIAIRGNVGGMLAPLLKATCKRELERIPDSMRDILEIFLCVGKSTVTEEIETKEIEAKEIEAKDKEAKDKEAKEIEAKEIAAKRILSMRDAHITNLVADSRIRYKARVSRSLMLLSDALTARLRSEAKTQRVHLGERTVIAVLGNNPHSRGTDIERGAEQTRRVYWEEGKLMAAIDETRRLASRITDGYVGAVVSIQKSRKCAKLRPMGRLSEMDMVDLMEKLERLRAGVPEGVEVDIRGLHKIIRCYYSELGLLRRVPLWVMHHLRTAIIDLRLQLRLQLRRYKVDVKYITYLGPLVSGILRQLSDYDAWCLLDEETMEIAAKDIMALSLELALCNDKDEGTSDPRGPLRTTLNAIPRVLRSFTRFDVMGDILLPTDFLVTLEPVKPCSDFVDEQNILNSRAWGLADIPDAYWAPIQQLIQDARFHYSTTKNEYVKRCTDMLRQVVYDEEKIAKKVRLQLEFAAEVKRLIALRNEKNLTADHTRSLDEPILTNFEALMEVQASLRAYIKLGIVPGIREIANIRTACVALDEKNDGLATLRDIARNAFKTWEENTSRETAAPLRTALDEYMCAAVSRVFYDTHTYGDQTTRRIAGDY